MFPGLKDQGLTGGAVFCDGQMYNPPRLAISFLRSAVNEGADAANYMEVTDFIRKGNRILGVNAEDVLSDTKVQIRGKMVLNTAGPWAHDLLRRSLGLRLIPQPTFSRDLAFVINRRAPAEYAIAFVTKTQDTDSIFDRGGRHLFAVPWRDRTLIGVWHKVFNGPPEEISVTGKELQGFVDEVNEANPSLSLKVEDISIINTGLTLFGDEKRQDLKNMSFGKRSRLIDHSRAHHIDGIVTLIGVRFTVARGMAEKAIDMVFKKLGKKKPKSKTSYTAIYGGQIEHFDEFLRKSIETDQGALDAEVLYPLIHNYGSRYCDVLRYIDEEPAWRRTLGSSKVLGAEVTHAIRDEMAQKLVDVVFRRTDLGTAGHPGEDAVMNCANLMASEMNWNKSRTEKEISEVMAKFPIYN
jgi:glycerol-3-phosphate dehydrogenase